MLHATLQIFKLVVDWGLLKTHKILPRFELLGAIVKGFLVHFPDLVV